MRPNSRIEIACIDPETYTSIINHDLRKEILRSLYLMSKVRPVTKQQLADHLRVGYHQLVYQLNPHLKDFWRVIEEQKVRGTRMELIGPAYPDTIFIALGKDNGIFMIDPIANIFGAIFKIGSRCDICSPAESRRCMTMVNQSLILGQEPKETEMAILMSNNRKLPFKVIDLAVIGALRRIPEGNTFVLEIPPEACPFMKKVTQFR